MQDAEEMPNNSILPQEPEESQAAAERPDFPEDQRSPSERAAAEDGSTASAREDTQPAAAELASVEQGAQAAAQEEAAGEPEQAPAEADARVDEEVDEEMDEDIDVVFEEAQDVFETPSQHPRMMTPGTSFGTARQQPTAYKTGQEHLTGACPRQIVSNSCI